MTSSPPAAPAPNWPAWTAPPDTLEPGTGTAAVAQALAWLEQLGERDGWPPKAQFALTLCADEALVNVSSYARTPGGEPAQLWLACGRTAGGLALRIEDNGTAFDPTAQEPPALAASLDDAVVGGHGLRLMRHYLSDLRYRREADRNVLLLEVAL
jgi:anti-sigma regulatory factor (Ser/Thr protein kinase)